jgi:hypothetical protein
VIDVGSPDWSAVVDGGGGDENLLRPSFIPQDQDFPIEYGVSIMLRRSRSFTLLDCIILIAFTALGFALWRDGLDQLLTARAEARSARFYWYNSIKFSYVLVAWSLALLVLSLRRPIPRLRRLAVRPAFLVGMVVLVDLCAKALGYLVAMGIGGADTVPLKGAKMFLLIQGPIEVGLALTITLGLQGLTFGRLRLIAWLDFAGRCLALLWMTLGWADYLFRLLAR